MPEEDIEISKRFSMERNSGFPIPYRIALNLDLNYLSEETIKILLNYAKWLDKQKIALEILGHREMEILMTIYNRVIVGFDLTKSMIEQLQIAIKRSLEQIYEKYPNNDKKILELEKQLEEIKLREKHYEFNEFYYKMERAKCKNLTIKTKIVLMLFASFLDEEKIALEICSIKQAEVLWRIFNRKDNSLKLSKVYREMLNEVKIRSKEYMKKYVP